MPERKSPRSLWRNWLPADPLAREITVVLLVKLAAIFLLWWAFFSGSGGDPGSGGAEKQLLSGISVSVPLHCTRS